jgi:hypothetical protein
MKPKRRSRPGMKPSAPRKPKGGHRGGLSGDCRLEGADDSEVDVLFHGFFVWIVIIQSASRNTHHNIKKATLPESPLMSTFTFTQIGRAAGRLADLSTAILRNWIGDTLKLWAATDTVVEGH